jgi:chromate transporter
MKDETTTVPAVTFGELLKVWAHIGCINFGGPAGQIAMMHRVLVEERKWLGEAEFLRALNFCMMLPGPEAMQLATYSGWKLHGVKGGLAAGLLFVLPGALVVLVLSMIYASFGRLPVVEALFFGVKAAVLAIVVEALLRIAKRALKLSSDWVIAALAFLALYVLNAPFPLVIAAAALIGFFRVSAAPSTTAATGNGVGWRRTAATAAVWLAVWLAPLALLVALLGPDHVLAKVGLFFSKLAVVTFGGAYAVLAYMAQAAVETHGWLTPEQMIDGLGLAETTPGPLILVTEFVGYMAGFRASGLLGSPLGGLIGAVITLWVTFAPCFLWIFVGAPYIERLARMPRLSGALAAITAAVVGVILNLSLWFGLHVVFAEVGRVTWGLVDMAWPDLTSLDWAALALSLIAALALLRLHLGIMGTLALCAGLGLAWRLEILYS